jgi:hypothetical protein
MADFFDFQSLRVLQPGKLLPNRARYEIFNPDKQLVAVAEEAEGHTRRQLLSKAMPDTRVFAVTTAAGQPLLSLVKQTSEWLTEVRDHEGALVGRIRTEGSRRHYTFLDEQDKTIGKAVGDLGLKKFSVTVADGYECARFSKTFAGLRKEMLTPSDHYKVEFTEAISGPVRTLTVMMPIVLDLTLYGPV